MSDTILIPTADAIIEPVIAKIIEKRPKSAQYLNSRTGVYWHPVLGYRAQAAMMLKRLAQLAAERRLKTATGKALLDYVASEYDAVPETDKTYAEGTITLGRGDGETFPGGDYPKGTRITRSAYTSYGVSLESAEYETLADAHIDVSSSVSVTIPIRATRTGAHANHPLLLASDPAQKITIPNLVANVIVTDFQVGGGSEGADDTFVRLFARAYSRGQFGPISSASKLGALSATGVRHLLVYDVPTTGTQHVLVADSSWGSSERWAGAVQQSIYDNDLVGFGCKVVVDRLRNQVISVDATISLRDATYLAETTEIDLAVQKAVRSYFDDRVDWNLWNADSLKAAITRAHTKIYSCSSVTVRDATSGAALDERTSPDYSSEQYHYYLASNAMKLTYVGPS